MICGLGALGTTGLSEVREPVLAPSPIVDELRGGTVGIMFLVEIDAFEDEPIEEEF